MLSALRKVMNGIVTIFDNMQCSVGCCSNTINVNVPQICTECSKRSVSTAGSSPARHGQSPSASYHASRSH